MTLEGSSASKFVEVIRRIKTPSDGVPEWAKVTAVAPELRIQIDGMKIELDADDFAVPVRLRGELTAGDRILIVGMNNGQAYAVIDRY